MKKSGGGKESDSAKQLRHRQILDMAQMDEEENDRIKNLFIRRSGSRAFRSGVRSAAGGGPNPSSGSSSRGGSLGGSGGFRGAVKQA